MSESLPSLFVIWIDIVVREIDGRDWWAERDDAPPSETAALERAGRNACPCPADPTGLAVEPSTAPSPARSILCPAMRTSFPEPSFRRPSLRLTRPARRNAPQLPTQRRCSRAGRAALPGGCQVRFRPPCTCSRAGSTFSCLLRPLRLSPSTSTGRASLKFLGVRMERRGRYRLLSTCRRARIDPLPLHTSGRRLTYPSRRQCEVALHPLLRTSSHPARAVAL